MLKETLLPKGRYINGNADSKGAGQSRTKIIIILKYKTRMHSFRFSACLDA